MKAERIKPISVDKKQAAAYARLAATEHAHKTVSRTEYLGGGSFGRAVGVRFTDGSSMVVKLLRAKGMAEKEVFDLGLLSAHCPVKFPEVYFRELDRAMCGQQTQIKDFLFRHALSPQKFYDHTAAVCKSHSDRPSERTAAEIFGA